MKRLSVTLILAACSLLAQAQNNFVVSVHSYITAQAMPNYAVHLKADTSAASPYYFPPVTYYTGSMGDYNGTLPAMPNGTRFHFECYDSCLGVTLGPVDTMQANLSYATGFSVCGNNSALPVSGTVYLAPSMPAANAMVYFISKCPDVPNNSYTLALMDSMQTNANGQYTLSNYPAMQQGCMLLVKAAMMTSSPFYSGYVPTYMGPGLGSFSWNAAVMVMPNSTANDIFMLPGTNPGGPGFVGGSVLQGANKTTGVGDPLSKRILILTNMNDQPVAYTYTNAAGQFSFPSLALGSYKLQGDALGKTNPPLTVVISTLNNSVNNIVFKENSTSFKGEFVTAVNSIATLNGKLSVYPNPVGNEIHIDGAEQLKGVKHVTVAGLAGMVAGNYEFAEGEVINIPSSHLAAGVYTVTVNTAEGRAILKILK